MRDIHTEHIETQTDQHTDKYIHIQRQQVYRQKNTYAITQDDRQTHRQREPEPARQPSIYTGKRRQKRVGQKQTDDNTHIYIHNYMHTYIQRNIQTQIAITTQTDTH